MCGYTCFAGEGLRGLVICPCILSFIYYVPSKCLLTHINTYIQAYKFPCWHTDLKDTQDEETYCPYPPTPPFPVPSTYTVSVPFIQFPLEHFQKEMKGRALVYIEHWEYSSCAVLCCACTATLCQTDPYRLDPYSAYKDYIFSVFSFSTSVNNVLICLFFLLKINFKYIFTSCSGVMANVLSDILFLLCRSFGHLTPICKQNRSRTVQFLVIGCFICNYSHAM